MTTGDEAPAEDHQQKAPSLLQRLMKLLTFFKPAEKPNGPPASESSASASAAADRSTASTVSDALVSLPETNNLPHATPNQRSPGMLKEDAVEVDEIADALLTAGE